LILLDLFGISPEKIAKIMKKSLFFSILLLLGSSVWAQKTEIQLL